MKLVEYIYTPDSGEYGIDLGYVPTTATSVQIRAKLTTDGNLTLGVIDTSDSWFRFFAYGGSWDPHVAFDCPSDSNLRIEFTPSLTADYVDYEFGFKDNGETMYIQDSLGNYSDGFAGDYTFNFVDGMKLWGDKYIYADSRIYDIKVFENGTMVKHYQPAYDDVQDKAGLWDGTTFYYPNAHQYDVAYADFPPFECDLKGTIGMAASGGVISGTIISRVTWGVDGYIDQHWEIKCLASNSASTINIDGQSGLTYYSAVTQGTFPFEIVVPANTSADRRILRHVAGSFWADESEDTGYYISVRQNGTGGGMPLYLGGDEIDTAYLGGDEVIAMYLGEDLVFGS